ncbi:hypothetical protein CANINC_001160 [Pichia inconspicua]|uniref:DUF4484 domain-containing protein n=1 Tax=Pichia inconspicua TaxID=52247 RepID=A0A4V4NG20_9ASCO|nr:hypothetical protein CANINC_001160 [[Candida] inconspicua]
MSDKLPPICALFLTKFDVHTGYELKWFRSIEDSLYSSSDLEFKSIPSGLHAVSTDTVCFVKHKQNLEDLIYGISIFKQNNHLQQIDDTGTIDRDKVKMYSLGVLVDPKHLEGLDDYKDWEPKIYSVCWNYRIKLSQLLGNFMSLQNEQQESDYFKQFDSFFNNHAQTKAILPTNATKLLPPLRPVDSKSSLASLLYDSEIQNDHMIDPLITFFNSLGPLIFKIWKISLLRKSIVIYCPHTTSPIIMDDTGEVKHENFDIGDLSKFLFCISLISAIPKDLEIQLKRSTKGSKLNLFFNRPVFNVSVNDIYHLVQLEKNYLASTTDQILVEKQNLFDYSIRLPLKSSPNNETIPEVKNMAKNRIELASPRDYERYKIIYSKLNNTNQEPAIASKVSENSSIQELAWKGLAWWATAGDSFKSVHDEFNIEFEYFDNLANDEVEKIVTLIGYFQQLTIKLFSGIIELVVKCENDILILTAHDIEELGLNPYCNSDCEFLIELVKTWWNKEVRIGSYINELCYWNS